MNINKNTLRNLLNPFYTHIEIIDETKSTNDDLKLVAQNINEPFLLIAKSQTNGKGRNGKSFYSPKNSGIYMSLLIKQHISKIDFLKISSMVGVAVCKSINELYNVSAKIKWINDIFISDKKVAGILCESSIKNGLVDYLIIGIGINVSKMEFDDELKEIATSIENNTNLKFDKEILISKILNEFYNILINNHDFLTYYKNNFYLNNSDIEILLKNNKISGTVLDIDENCNLIVETKNGILKLNSGEISIKKSKII